MLSRAAFRFEDCSVAVAAPESDLHWLASFLDCGFEQVCERSDDPVVELVIDAPAYERLCRDGKRAGASPVVGFAGDGGVRTFEPWSCAGPEAVFRDAEQPVFYVVSPGGSRVALVAREASPKLRTALMRVVRELVMDRIASSGGALLHAAAVSTEAGALVICGPKQSGKTTLLMALLQSTDVRYVSNDRCLLRVGVRGIQARGVPTLVSIRREALAHFPDVRARLDRVRPDLAALEQGQRAKFSLTPPQLCELMGAGRCAGGPLRTLLFPRIRLGAREFSLRRLDAAEMLARLRLGLFRADADTILGDVFVSDRERALRSTSRELAAPVCAALAATVPGFECELGSGEPPEAGRRRELLDTVMRRAQTGSSEVRAHA